MGAVPYVTGPEYLQQQHPEYLTIRTFIFCHKLPCNGEITELTGSVVTRDRSLWFKAPNTTAHHLSRS